MNTKTCTAVLACLVFGAVFTFVCSAEDEEEGKAVSVPKDDPVFTVTVPADWRDQDAPSGMSPEIWSPDNGVNLSFRKLGELPDDNAAQTKITNEAKAHAVWESNVKIGNAAPGEEIAGHKSYQVSETYMSSGTDPYMYQVNAFTIDGKTYYAAMFRGPEEKIKAASETIAHLLASIKAK
jgi:hypothetical protein